MPAKAPLDENVKFLYSCLIRSDYKTIDFSRVAADFAINPAAARMRWSRLKKSINPDDMWSQPVLEALPKKVKKKAPKVPKEETEEQEEKLVKDEAKELELEDSIKDNSTPRKAKLKASKKIGVVVKDEQDERRFDMDGDGEGEITLGDKGEDENMFQMPENEPAVELAAAAAAAAPQKDFFKVEEQDDMTPPQLTQESTQKEKTPPRDIPSLPLDMFPVPPAPPFLSKSPVTQALDPISLPERKEDEDDEDEGWGATIVVKHETNPDPKTPTKRKFSATLGSASPASSVSSFSPPSARSSPSPSRTPRKSERTPQRWQAIVSRSRQPRSKSRRVYSEENEPDNEDEHLPL